MVKKDTELVKDIKTFVVGYSYPTFVCGGSIMYLVGPSLIYKEIVINHMILSHSRKFVFVRTKKVAGSSVESYLEPFVEKGEVRNGRPNERGELYYHSPANHIIERIGKERWEEYFTFSIARHPFDRMISEYFWARIPRETFSDFIRSPRAIHTQNHTVLNTGLYQPIDFIIKYENLQEDLTKVLNRLEIPVDLSKLGNEKGTQRKDRRHWSEFINDVDMNYIKSHFEQELRFHRNLGYDV